MRPVDRETATVPPVRQGHRAALDTWVESRQVQWFIVGVILVNAAVLGLQTVPRFDRGVSGDLLQALDVGCLAVFVVEIAVKLYAKGWGFFASGWNVFDFLVVAVALVPAGGGLSVLRALRVLRVLRLISAVPRLRYVVEALVHAVPGILSIGGLLTLIFYVGAVMATNLFGEEFPQWFGSIGGSMYSLFQIMTLESWSMGIVRPVMEVYPWAWAFFVPFILVSAFTVLNLFMAVMVDSLQSLRHNPDAWPEQPPEDRIAEDTNAQVRELRAELAAVQRQLGDVATRLAQSTPAGPREE
jgi:voltage-gated sodium channel